jgi:ribonuclease HI
MAVIIYTDGGARGNPGPAGAGVVIQKDGATVAELKKYLGDGITNNWAEYEALLLALEETRKLGLHREDIEIRMDSELIVRQMKGEYKVKDKNLKVQFLKADDILGEFGKVRFQHIPRAENSEADRLVNEAIDAAV